MKPVKIGKMLFLKDLIAKMRRKALNNEIRSIMNVVLEELMKDLESGKEIKVHNYGTMQLITYMPSNHYSPLKKATVLCVPYRNYFFKIAQSIKKELLQNWDIDNRPDGA